MDVAYAIFDLDGTLLDTEAMYTIATQEYLDEYAPGVTFTYEMKKEMMGRHIDVATRRLLDMLHINDTVEHAVAYKIEHLARLWPRVRPLPGAMRVLEYFKRHGIPMALATSTTAPVFAQKMAGNQEMLAYFDAVVLGDDPAVAEAKPSPAIFLEAGRRLGCTDMRRALVFEDAVLGVQAGVAAGATTIAVPDPRNAADPAFRAANVVLASLNDFRPADFGLPDDY